jgi:hypothetical protein
VLSIEHEEVFWRGHEEESRIGLSTFVEAQ